MSDNITPKQCSLFVINEQPKGLIIHILGFSATVQDGSKALQVSSVYVPGVISEQFNILQALLFSSSSFQLHLVILSLNIVHYY